MRLHYGTMNTNTKNKDMYWFKNKQGVWKIKEKSLIGKILCKLGIHKWEVVEMYYSNGWDRGFLYHRTRCKRCNKLKKIK